MKYTAQNIRKLRRKLSWSQKMLADFAGCSRNSVVLVEKGLDAPVKQKIIKALEIGQTEP